MKTNKPTQEQRKHWEKVRELGCIICGEPAYIHHCFTKMGTRKDHDKVIPLCYWHHRSNSSLDINSGKRTWQEKYGTELELLNKVLDLLEK